ncbi:MAG: peptidylprolyl isomerase [Ilumatobacteraceae bacterium]
MGTEKRARQKTNRAKRRQEELRQERVTSVRKRVMRIAAVAVVAIAGVVVIAWIGGAFDAEEVAAPAPSTSPATSPADDPDGDGGGIDADVPPGCPAPDDSESQQRQFDEPPPMCLDDDVDYSAVVDTNFGEYTIDLDADAAPLAVNNFVVLARYQYFDDTRCHRIIPDFVVQCGDPTGTGTGDPGYRFADELPDEGEYEIGSVAMANSGPDTNGSQFFVISGPQGEALPPNFSLFGQVTDGLDVIAELDAVGSPGGDPTEPVQIRSVEILES